MSEIKVNHEEAKKIIREKYKEAGGTDHGTVARLIDIMDDEFLDQFIKDYINIIPQVEQSFSNLNRQAGRSIAMLDQEIKKADDLMEMLQGSSEVSDPRVADALKAYIKIVSLDFDTVEQKTWNIRNASYFIWALFAQDGLARTMKDLNTMPPVEIKDDAVEIIKPKKGTRI